MRNPRNVTEWINSLTADQMSRVYEIIDGPIDPAIAAMSDDDLMAELTEARHDA